MRSAVGAIGSAFIYFLIWLFGRRVRTADAPWLSGPIGGAHIGDRPYEEQAEREGLAVTRNAVEGGLIPRFDVLGGPGFDVQRVHPEVRRFYEQTAGYRMDVWAKTFFPSRIALWLLVSTISRRVDQLNFPVDTFETAGGMDSEIVLLTRPSGEPRYTGWFRRLRKDGRVLYTGFYMTERVPASPSACVKVVFPMPNGNATVILRPEIAGDGSFVLDSAGGRFGDVGFYRVQRSRDDHVRVWRIRSLVERFRLWVDPDGTLRCDHRVRFLGLPVLHLHYRIERASSRAAAA